MNIPKGTTPITLKEAEKLMGTVMRESNRMPAHGFNIPLDSPETRFFRCEEYDIVSILHGGREYSFDGLGWADETEWREHCAHRPTATCRVCVLNKMA